MVKSYFLTNYKSQEPLINLKVLIEAIDPSALTILALVSHSQKTSKQKDKIK